VSFCACFGYSKCATRPHPTSGFLNLPYPIDFGIFRDRCSDQVFVIVLASTGSEDILHDEGKMCSIVEDYAAFGGRELTQIIDELGEESFLSELARRYFDFQASGSQLQI
jgi:hypothetical protein